MKTNWFLKMIFPLIKKKNNEHNICNNSDNYIHIIRNIKMY